MSQLSPAAEFEKSKECTCMLVVSTSCKTQIWVKGWSTLATRLLEHKTKVVWIQRWTLEQLLRFKFHRRKHWFQWFETCTKLERLVWDCVELQRIGDFRIAFLLCFKYRQIVVHLHVNKTNFHMKGFALRALKQRWKATRKLPIHRAADFTLYEFHNGNVCVKITLSVACSLIQHLLSPQGPRYLLAPVLVGG